MCYKSPIAKRCSHKLVTLQPQARSLGSAANAKMCGVAVRVLSRSPIVNIYYVDVAVFRCWLLGVMWRDADSIHNVALKAFTCHFRVVLCFAKRFV